MHTDIPGNIHAAYERRSKRGAKNPAFIFLILWVVLIAGGVYGSIRYTQSLKADMTAEIETQTAQQIAAMQADYVKRIETLEADTSAEIAVLQGKVDALNELLTFTKDNANSKTDNSNQLYTQINEVKKKLNELQKSLDVLK